jgi:hypothetical protein
MGAEEYRERIDSLSEEEEIEADEDEEESDEDETSITDEFK